MNRANLSKGFIYEKSQGHCYYCGTFINPFFAEFHIDHVQPTTRGGSEAYDNRVPCCNHCNSSKHDKTLEEFRRYTDLGTFWYERQGLTLDHVPLGLPAGWFTLNRAPMTTDWQIQRVITVLKKYPGINKSRLQKMCSPYRIKNTDLMPILETLEREGSLTRYPGPRRGQRFRWTGK